MPIKAAIVEDDRHYSNALKKIINYDGELLCQEQYFDGAEAIEKLPHTQPDVVLVDIKLPYFLGYEIIQKISSSMENTQFMMCTSFEDDENIFKSLKAGATGYLVKGDSMEKLLAPSKNCITVVHP